MKLWIALALTLSLSACGTMEYFMADAGVDCPSCAALETV